MSAKNAYHRIILLLVVVLIASCNSGVNQNPVVSSDVISSRDSTDLEGPDSLIHKQTVRPSSKLGHSAEKASDDLPGIESMVTSSNFDITTSSFATTTSDFKTEQLTYSRVRTAYEEKRDYIEAFLKENGYNGFDNELFIRIFKEDDEVEVWIRPSATSSADGEFKLLITYAICDSSGVLGPKRRYGDEQIPEGFYHIDRFNPFSDFYLSLGLNYPNASDKILGEQGNLGGDIFIHGDCVTIGCVPITNSLIKEVYVLAIEARSTGQIKIPVHIFPTRLTDENLRILDDKDYSDALLNFWRNLKPGYDYFEENHVLPEIRVDNNGEYYLKD